MSVADLYIAQIPEGAMDVVYPSRRQLYIENSANETSRKQRYYVWKLLEYALKSSLDLPIESVDFSVDERGKWSCGECFFSLSHSGNAVAVAVSDRSVGVDIEDAGRLCSDGMAQKILTERELCEYSALDGRHQNLYLIQKWCAKESVFKASGSRHFSPRKIETQCGVCVGTSKVGKSLFCYSVATEYCDKLRVFADIVL